MKKCNKCELIKTFNDFARNATCKDGYEYWCKICRKLFYSAPHRIISQLKAGKRLRKKLKYTTSLEVRKTYLQKYPERHRARTAIGRAVKYGKIERPSICCECGTTCNPVSHHPNGYSEQHIFDIVWLCKECHYKRHTKLEFQKFHEIAKKELYEESRFDGSL